MIIQQRTDDIAVIAQADHARLAGEMAARWRARFGRWDQLVKATARHDDGWIEWDQSPKFGQSGAPFDFISAPTDDRVEIYAKGVRAVLEEHPWTVLLVSMHLTGLFLGRYEPNASPMIDNLPVSDQQVARRFIEEETARQNRIKEELGSDPLAHYRLVQVFDRLSLTLCLQPLSFIGKNSIDFVPFDDSDEGTLTLWAEEGVIKLDPYPFQSERFTLTMPARALPKEALSDPSTYRRSFDAAVVEDLEFTFAPG